jgi:hypothetical protein
LYLCPAAAEVRNRFGSLFEEALQVLRPTKPRRRGKCPN